MTFPDEALDRLFAGHLRAWFAQTNSTLRKMGEKTLAVAGSREHPFHRLARTDPEALWAAIQDSLNRNLQPDPPVADGFIRMLKTIGPEGTLEHMVINPDAAWAHRVTEEQREGVRALFLEYWR